MRLGCSINIHNNTESMDALSVPYRDHVVVHVLQLGFCGMEGIWRWVELVGFEALVRESDLERLVIFLAIESCQLPYGFQGRRRLDADRGNRFFLCMRRRGIGGDGSLGQTGRKSLP